MKPEDWIPFDGVLGLSLKDWEKGRSEIPREVLVFRKDKDGVRIEQVPSSHIDSDGFDRGRREHFTHYAFIVEPETE